MVDGQTGGNGGGFVVLRLVRLTRIFRAFRIGKYVDSVVVIQRTLIQSTKALYVLAFNLALGVVIFGSLMYLMEHQNYNSETRTYERQVSTHWDDTEKKYVADMGESPWKSIPYCFWWAIVTASSVGYGDEYPTSPLGKFVAAICMMWGLVILALPVGVIGGTFTQVWHDFAHLKKVEAEQLRAEMVYVASAVQRVQPQIVSHLVLIQIWDEDGSDPTRLPNNPESFMGEVKLQLELPQDRPFTRELKLPLRGNHKICQRTISGYVYARYDWTPSPSPAPQQTSASSISGTLVFHTRGATGLINTDWSHAQGRSSPYALVVCYPNSPPGGDDLTPMVWRSAVVDQSLNPSWDCHETIEYLWQDADAQPGQSTRVRRESRMTRKFLPAHVNQRQKDALAREPRLAEQSNSSNGMTTLLVKLAGDMSSITAVMDTLQNDVQTLTRQMDHLQFSASY
jgi:hypothetical protein